MNTPTDLITAYFLRTITADDFARLSAWLEEDPGHAKILVRESILHEALHHVLTGELLHQAEAAVDEASSLVGREIWEIPPLPTPAIDDEKIREIERLAQRQLNDFLRREHQEAMPPMQSRPRWDLVAAMGAFRLRMQFVFQKTVTVAKVTAIGFAAAFIILLIGLYIQSHRSVAIIADSTDAQWRIPKEPEAALYRGWHYLEAGYARIVMRKGAEVLLQAPCAIELNSPNRLYLESGSLSAIVPQRAQGFSVETVTSKIVDYGTEFGAMVEREDQVEIHVFKGSIGVGPRATSSGVTPRNVTAGKAVLLNEGKSIQEIPLEGRTRLFVRSLPSESGFGIPGKRVDLADLIGNGNGFGTGHLGHGIDLASGQIVPVKVIANNAVARGYVPLPEMSFIDGVFIPDGEQTGQTVTSSTGLVFRGCPDTRGRARGYLINGAIFGGGDQEDENRVHFGKLQGRTYGTKQFPSIGMHANAGVTFDLRTLRQSIPNRRIGRFTAMCGVSESAGQFFDGYYGDDPYRVTVDFWVLVDGEVQFHRSLNAVPSEPASIDIELPSSARFLTLMTTDSQMRTSFCWGMFAQPALELEEE